MTTPPPPKLRDLLTRDLPPQRAFSYPRATWLRWTGDVPDVAEAVNSLPDAVDRAIVARAVEDLIQRGRFVPAFVVSMIWGHGTSNYGPFRTARIASGRTKSGMTAMDVLTDSVRIAGDAGTVEAYRYLNNDGHLPGLGPAFFTKWLYFVTARGQARSAEAAPVLDALIIRWLRTEADVTVRPERTPEYERYLELLCAWGEPHGLTRVEVEERIFRLIRRDAATS